MCVNMFEDFFSLWADKKGRKIYYVEEFILKMNVMFVFLHFGEMKLLVKRLKVLILKKKNYSDTSSTKFMGNKGVNSWMNNQSINNSYWHAMLLVNQYHSIIENTHKESINIINIRCPSLLVNQYHSIIEDTPKQWINIINIRCSLLMVNQYQSIIECILEQSINKSQYSFIE